MADIMDFLDDDAFDNCNFESTTTIPESPASTLKKSSKKSSKSSKTSHSTTNGAGSSNSLERKKKKEKERKDQEAQAQAQIQAQLNGHDFGDAYALSLDILENGEMENSSRWVNKNSKKLAELFSMPIENISIASPHEDHLPSTSPKKSSTIKKESIKSEHDVVILDDNSKSSSSKSNKSKSSKKSHKSTSSTEMTPSQANQVVQTSLFGAQTIHQQQPQPLQPPQISFTQQSSYPLSQEAQQLFPPHNSANSSSPPSSKMTDEELESKRQFHLACEQTRRKHIKDGLEELRNSLPSCENQKMTKAAILSKAIAFVQHSKRQKEYMAAQINVLRQENHYLRSACQCHQRGGAVHDHSLNFVPTLPNAAFLKQQEKLQEYPPIQPKSQPKNIRPNSTFIQPQLNQTEPPPPYSLPRHSNLLSVPDMRFRNPSSPASSIDGDSDTRSWADESEALPPGWEEIMTPDGKIFYVNKKAGLSSWVDPRQNHAINISSKHQRSSSRSSNHSYQSNQSNAPQYVDPLSVPVSPQWNASSLPDFMLPDLSAIQFGQSLDSEMSDVKHRPMGLGVDVNQCYSN